jgi:hypothetical protein
MLISILLFLENVQLVLHLGKYIFTSIILEEKKERVIGTYGYNGNSKLFS